VTGRIRIESSIYYNSYNNQQVAYYTVLGGRVANAASSEIYGAELSLNGKVTDNLTLGVNGAYTHGRYLHYTNATRSLLSGTSNVDISGQPMERTPDFTATLFANYEHPLADGKISLNASYYLSSKFRLDPAGDYNQGGYGLLNARATYTMPGGHYSISAFGNNITDTKYTASVLPLVLFAILQEWGPPASWGVELAYKF
jgi:iron complex outermembrane recepter protein